LERCSTINCNSKCSRSKHYSRSRINSLRSSIQKDKG
jgi:hypothetical protein